MDLINLHVSREIDVHSNNGKCFGLLTVPANYVSCKKQFVEEFRKANNVEEQIDAVKNIFNGKKDKYKIRFLADIIFDAIIDHPVRNEIIIIFDEDFYDEESQHKIIVSALEQSIKTKLDSTFKLKCGVDKIYAVISISECLIQFPSGLEALNPNYKKYIQIIFDILTSLHNLRSENLSASRVQEYQYYIQNIIKILFWCIHKFPGILKDFAGRIHDALNNISILFQIHIVPLDMRLMTVELTLELAESFGVFDDIVKVGINSEHALQMPYAISLLNLYNLDKDRRDSSFYMNVLSMCVNIAIKPEDVTHTLNAFSKFAIHLKYMNYEEDESDSWNNSKLSLRMIILFGILHLENTETIICEQSRRLVTDTMATARLVYKFDQLIDKIYENCISDRLKMPTICFLLRQSEGNDYKRFPLVYYNICSEIIDFAKRDDISFEHLILSFRALWQFVHNLRSLEIPEMEHRSLVHFKLALRSIILFLTTNFEFYMATVRSLCCDLLKEVLLSAKYLEFNQLADKIYELCKTDNINLSAKCTMVQQIFYVYGIEEIVKNCQNLFLPAFSKYLGRSQPIEEMCERLIISTYHPKCFDSWSKIWLVFILNIALLNDERLQSVINLLIKILHLDSRIKDFIIDKQDLSPSTLLQIIFPKTPMSIKMELSKDNMRKLSKVFRDSMINAKIEMAHTALYIIMRNGDLFESERDFKSQNVVTFFDYQANNPDRVIRGQSYALLNGLITQFRLHISFEYQYNRIGLEQHIDSIFFLRYVMNSMVKNLFPGGNCSRHSLAMQILQPCLQICKIIKLNYDKILPSNGVRCIFGMLSDPAEDNKIKALAMLKELETQEPLGLIKTYKIPLTKESIKSKLTSLFPSYVKTGAYQLEFLCNRESNLETFGSCPTDVQYEPTVYVALKWCLKELLAGLEMAQKNLNRAVKFNALYGFLYAIRHLLKQVKFNVIVSEPSWYAFMADLMEPFKDLTEVVKPILDNSKSSHNQSFNDFNDPISFFYDYQNPDTNNESQENDINEIIVPEFVTKNLTRDMLEQIKTTPQMRLSFAWRTVKEVALILADIMMEAPIEHCIQSDDNVAKDDIPSKYLLNKTQIVYFGVYLKDLLAINKNTLAFKYVFIALSSYCKRLWVNDPTFMSVLPMQWLKTGLQYSSDLNPSVAYIVQAIITTKPVDKSKSLVHQTFVTLLKNCANNSKADLENRIHSMNIMRNLLRCSILKQHIDEFIFQCIICALNIYETPYRRERFTVALFYSEILKCIFNTKTDEPPMTRRMFVLKYPMFYSYFLAELKDTKTLLNSGKCALKLQPILLLLNRMSSSELDHTYSNFLITFEFLPLISSFYIDTNLYVRTLVAKVVVGLLDKHAYEKLLSYKCKQLVIITNDPKQDPIQVTNSAVHGILLQISHLMKSLEVLTIDVVKMVIENLSKFTKAFSVNTYALLQITFDILIMIVESQTSMSSFERENDHELVKHFVDIGKNVVDTARFYPELHRCYENYMFHLFRLIFSEQQLIQYFIDSCANIEKAAPGSMQAFLNVILILLYGTNAKTCILEENNMLPEFMKSFNCNETEYKFCLQLSTETRNDFAMKLRGYDCLRDQFFIFLKKEPDNFDTALSSKCLAILSMMENVTFDLQILLTQSKQHINKIPISMCIIRHIQDNGIENKQWVPVLNYALKIIDSSNPIILRFKAAQLLHSIIPYFRKQLGLRHLHIIIPYVKLVVFLLMDENIAVREFTSKILMNNLKHQIDIPKFLFWPNCERDTVYVHGDETLAPTLTQQLVFQNIADVLAYANASNNFILEVFSLIVDPFLPPLEEKKTIKTDAANSDLNKERQVIITQFANNNYAEPFKVVIDMLVAFRKTFKERAALMKKLNSYDKRVSDEETG